MGRDHQVAGLHSIVHCDVHAPTPSACGKGQLLACGIVCRAPGRALSAHISKGFPVGSDLRHP